MAEQGVTVVIPTLNREAFTLVTVRDLLAQHHRPLEVFIVDQSTQRSSNLSSVAEQHPELVTYHHVRFRGSAKARNHGWQLARYSAVVFVDDDIRCGPDFVGEHLRALSTPGVGLVAGGIESQDRPADAGPPTGRFVRWTATPITGFGASAEFDVDHAQECNFSVWRFAAEKVGGIDEVFDVPTGLYEGLDLSLRIKRAGFRVLFNGRARLLHLAAPNGGNRVHQVEQYVWGLAHNRAVVIRRYLRWYHVPTAMARLALLGASYAAHYHAARALVTCIAGLHAGWHRASHAPIVSRHDTPGANL